MRGCFDGLSIANLYTKCKHFFVIFLTAFYPRVKNKRRAVRYFIISSLQRAAKLFIIGSQHNHAVAIGCAVAADT